MNNKWVILLLILISSGLIYYTCFYYHGKSDEEIAQILGITEASTISADYSYDPFTLRDYDVMEVYHLSNSTIHFFITNSSFELCDKPYENPEWLKENWHICPIDTIKWKDKCEIAFSIRFDSKKRNQWSSEILKLLNSDYAYFASYSTNGAVAFYILDPIKQQLYITYVNM